MTAGTDRAATIATSRATSPVPEQHQLRAFHPWGARAGRGQEKTSRGVEAVAARLSPEGPSQNIAIDRWQAGRSPRAISKLPRGEAVCPSLLTATVGAGRHLRSAPFFAGVRA